MSVGGYEQFWRHIERWFLQNHRRTEGK